jgi:hypothetical protein
VKGDCHRCIPVRPHERLSRSSATALPMAAGSSLYPVGTWKNSPPRPLTSLAACGLQPLPLSPSDGERAGVRGRPSVVHPTESSVLWLDFNGDTLPLVPKTAEMTGPFNLPFGTYPSLRPNPTLKPLSLPTSFHRSSQFPFCAPDSNSPRGSPGSHCGPV